MQRPALPGNYLLGAQPKFSEMKLATESHKEANIKVKGENSIKIKLKAGTPVKVTARLQDYTSGSDKLIEGLVFTERKNKEEVRFHVGFPGDGFFKFEIFAIEETSSTDSLPNVYNYFIEVVNCPKPAIPYAKAYTKFYADCCTLDEPMALNSSSPGLDNVKFELSVPGAEKVAVHCGEEWFHLEKKGGEFKGKANLERYKGGNKVTVNANYDANANSYSVLLEYNI